MTNNIEEKYSELLKTADSIGKDIKENDGKITDKNMDSILNVLKDSDGASERDEMNAKIEKMKSEEPIETKEVVVQSSYDPATGVVTSVPVADNDDELDKEIEDILNSEMDIDSELGKKFLNEMDIKDANIVMTLLSIMKAWDNGDHSNPYNKLPEEIKIQLNAQIVAADMPLTQQTKSMAAKSFISDLVDNFYSKQATFDIESSLKEMADATSELNTYFGSESINMYITMVKKSRETILVEDSEKVKEMKDMAYGIIDSYDLDKFITFCKTSKCKIKTFDLQKPEKVYKEFNYKYFNHRNGINNIGSVPYIISRVFDVDEPTSHLIPIAFCKYAINLKPDNKYDHTFMYYFIKSFIYMDLIKSNLESESVNKDVLNLYDHFSELYKEILGILIEKKSPAKNK